MGAEPFVVEVEVKRVTALPESGESYHIGAAFVAIGQEQRELIARFTRS
jgi:hypothetical protein